MIQDPKSNSLVSEVEVLPSGDIQVIDFFPRTESSLAKLINNTPDAKIFYFQRPLEHFTAGRKYSLFLYSRSIQFYLREYSLPPDYSVSHGMSDEVSTQTLKLATDLNDNEIIFPNSMALNHHKNSLLVHNGGLAVNVYLGTHLIAHTAVVRLKDKALKTGDDHFILMRFLVHRDHRQSNGVKEYLIHEIANFLPPDSSLSLQVFPKNHQAQRFFSRRMNVVPYLEKWVVNES